MPSYNIHISGSVFKTGFRYYLKAKADMCGIKGRVCYDNGASVRATISGSREKIRKFFECCNVANPFFKISHMEIKETAAEEFSSFDVQDDAPVYTDLKTDKS